MNKFEVRTDPQDDGSEGWNEEYRGIVDVDTGDVLLTANHDEHGWAGMELLSKACGVLNQVWEHPEDFS